VLEYIHEGELVAAPAPKQLRPCYCDSAYHPNGC